MLKLMTEKGLLVSEEYGRGTRYVLPINGIDILREEPSNVATSAPNVATSIKKKCLVRNCKNSYCRIAKNGFLFIRQFIINHTLHFVGDKMQCTVKSIFNYC